MKTILLFALVTWGLAEASVRYTREDLRAFEDFKHKYKKTYTQSEEGKRKSTFISNFRWVKEQNLKYNNDESSFTAAINRFSDMTTKERHEMNKCISFNQSLSGMPYNLQKTNTTETLDWRKLSAVTDVKNQKCCGSCWAFSAAGAIESHMFIKKKSRLESLSEQNLVDCSGEQGNNGCDGGSPDRAFQYVKQNNGIDSEKNYPYKYVKQDQCYYNPEDSVANINGFVRIPQGDEEALLQAVAQVGPVSVLIDTSNPAFSHYKSGVLDVPDCGNELEDLNHAVLVVGYGQMITTAGKTTKFFQVKNSWGKTWGKKGYIYMSRNKNNQCGIATYATYPII